VYGTVVGSPIQLTLEEVAATCRQS